MKRRLQEMQGTVPDARIPYDRTDPLVDAPGPPAPDAGVGLEAPPAGAEMGGAPANLLSQVGGGGDTGLQGTDQLTDADLAALGAPVEGLQSPEEMQAMDLEGQLMGGGPEAGMAQQQLELAARRRLAGIGGLGV